MTVSDLTALLSAATGSVAAFYWYRASKIPVMPAWEYDPKLRPPDIADFRG
jgi:hypothetical protein